MSEKIKLTIEGTKFHLTREEAAFINQHLRTALAQPDLALSFSQRRSGGSGEIKLSRQVASAPASETDC